MIRHRQVPLCQSVFFLFLLLFHCHLLTSAFRDRGAIVIMVSIHYQWRYLFMFLGIQLVVMALLSRESYQKRVSYFIRIFRKPDAALSSRNSSAASLPGVDVYANLSHLSKAPNHGDDVPYCSKMSPLISKLSSLL